MMKRYVTVGPFSAFFTNINTEMGLKGHSHFAEITLRYAQDGVIGFPAFEGTYRDVQSRIKELTAAPFKGMTNEAVAAWLFTAFSTFSTAEIEKWQGKFHLSRLDLAVRGVPDAIGHADGFTTYTVEDQG